MKRSLLYFFLASIPVPAFGCCNAVQLQGNSFLSPRSQSLNTARELAGWHPYIDRYVNDEWYGTFAITPEYTRSFRPKRLAQYFFGTNILTVTGSQVEDRGNLDILADYFGLSPTFSSFVHLEPIWQNMLADFSFYGGWNAWYLRVHAPLVRAKTEIRLREKIIDNGTDTPYPADYMDPSELAAPFTSFSSAIRNSKNFGQVAARAFGSMCCDKSITRLSDVHMILGWNFFRREYGHAGINFHTSAPTGNKPRDRCIFEPIVGNGHHWTVGAGVSAHGLVWEKDGEQEWNVLVDGSVRHVFKTCQRRSFDLRSRFCIQTKGFGSRYILAKKFDDTGAYTGVTEPLINATTLFANVHVAVEFEGAVIFVYTNKHFSMDIGYNPWLRSREKISCIQQFPQDTYGLKGIQDVTSSGIPSVVTQSCATLHGNDFDDQAAVADVNPPVFIDPSAIDPRSAENPQTFTHKIFWNLQYNQDLPDSSMSGYIGWGTEIEFEGFRPKYDFHPNHVAMSQWGMWLKCGLGY